MKLADVLGPKSKPAKTITVPKFALPDIKPAITLDWKKLGEIYADMGIRLNKTIRSPWEDGYHC